MSKTFYLTFLIVLFASCESIKVINVPKPKTEYFCKFKDKYFKKYNWKSETSCSKLDLKIYKNHLVYFESNQHSTKTPNKTLILCGVHGDEITPVKFCFDLLDEFAKSKISLTNEKVVIAPLVVPSSFFKKTPSRTNRHGVDVNRNFPTRDWDLNALKLWENRYKKDKRRFPGKTAGSEVETQFQMHLIRELKPHKIITVHAPLNLIDYDGPSISNFHGIKANKILKSMSQKAGKYRIFNYPFFTGSLGNWAGNEQGIPTYTLELPDTDSNKTDLYFNKFYSSIITAIHSKIHE